MIWQQTTEQSQRPFSARDLKLSLAPWQAAALFSPITHVAMYGGVGVGKSFTGAHFAIINILEHPECMGFIGANSYDQLTQASLKELFYWLDYYGLEWVIDQMPPPHWGAPRLFKKYANILSVRHPNGKTVHVFTRVLADPNPLRGVEFSWYWIDETRDTPRETHDVILARMRESAWTKGLVTTTTNGQDWSYDRFVLGNDGKLYGALHVPTYEAVKLGILTEEYYQVMRRSYSALFAEQELEAKHVNVNAGRAYYAAGAWNELRVAPWGDAYPNRERPLILGCDFNYAPAPHVWMVGQLGPPLLGPNGQLFSEHIHWFGEVSQTMCSTPEMTERVCNQYPDFPSYRVFGDASGGKGTTSNAGEHDYAQIQEVFHDYGYSCSIEIDWGENGNAKGNPRVKNRVENMNARYRNALGEVRQTYNPDTCIHLKRDNDFVGWKQVSQRGEAKLDNGGDVNRTHASDGAGYAVWRLFPPRRHVYMGKNVPGQFASATA